MDTEPPIACGHGCVLARAQGMATNGGCHCLDADRMADPNHRVKVRAAILYWRRKAGDLESVQTSRK